MLTRRTTNRPFARRATALIQAVLFGSTVGVGVAALAVDTGLMFASRAELQNAADAAALAAASQLGGSDAVSEAVLAEAALFASRHNVAGDQADLIDADVILGHAVMSNQKYLFQAGSHPFDAVRITLRRDPTAADGPVSLLFGKMLGVDSASLTATAVAMVVPRDIAVVIDLSGSMNDDSELRHHQEHPSEISGDPDKPGVQVNLRDIWCALNGPAPNRPYGPGLPTQTQYASDTGPTWGQMNAWGSQVVLDAYDATTDAGLTYLKKSVNCTSSAVLTQLTGRGYRTAASSSPSTMSEVDCLMKGTKDTSYTNNFKNRTKVILGLAEWRSGKSQSKYGHNVGGDADDKVEDNELTALLSYPSGMSAGSWDDWINNYVSVTTEMSQTDSSLRYRYGLKTFVNYLLEDRGKNSSTPQLATCPELPLRSVKDAVQTLIDTIVELDTEDHVSLEVFATSGRHEVDLTDDSSSADLQVIPDTLYMRQAGHYNNTTCIGCGFDLAVEELTSDRARSAAAKVIILMTDGKPNVGGSGHSPSEYVVNRAEAAAEAEMTIYTVGVGSDLDHDLLQQVADIGQGEYFFATSEPDPATGQPQYVEQLQEIFEALGGRRPVRLVQ